MSTVLTVFFLNEENIVIGVSAGQVIAATYTPSGIALDSSEYPRLHTVEKMFAVVQRAINDADVVDVIFNDWKIQN